MLQAYQKRGTDYIYNIINTRISVTSRPTFYRITSSIYNHHN